MSSQLQSLNIQEVKNLRTAGGALLPPVLRVSGLSKAYGGQKVLDDLSIDLNHGEIVLLRGDNGAGKTTLLNILTGNLEPDSGAIHTNADGLIEEFIFPKRWWNNLNPFNHFTPERLAREGIGRTWQEVRLFNTADLLDNLAVAVPNQIGENPLWSFLRFNAWRKQDKEIYRQSKVLLDKVGLAQRANSSADKISLGQSKRVAIARAVQAGARVLFLDEPLAGLDKHGIEEVLSLLHELSQLSNITLVIVEHVFNIPHILNIATTVWTLKDGRIVQEDPTALKHELSQIDNFQFNSWISNISGSPTVTDTKLPGGAILSTISSNASLNQPVVFEIENLVAYRGKRMVIGEKLVDGTVSGLFLTLKKGQLAILQAPNGWGKTTLLEAVAGLIPVASGTIRINGEAIQKLSIWRRAVLGLSFLQSRNNMFAGLTVKETFAIAGIKSTPPQIEFLLSRRMSDLSGGERQRVLLAAVLNKSNVLVQLLDEPFSALDPKRTEDLKATLVEVLDHSALLVAIPAISHDLVATSV